MRRCPVPASGANAYLAWADVVPLLGLPSDIRCHRRARYPRRKPLIPITSRPRSPFQRRTAKRAAFQKTGMPFAATTREGILLRNSCRRRIAPPAPSRRLSRSRRPHFFPISGGVLCLGLASVTVRSPAIRDGSTRRWFESTDAFVTPLVMPGTDDPSMPGSSTDLAVDGS
jgi:hypothetical protein